MSLNSHFVSRFLTTPWEHGQRRLWYYDFERDRIFSASSKSLFARLGANSDEVEGRLNLLVESPISKARDQLSASGKDVSPDLQWPLYRALAMLLFLQPFRAAGGAGGAAASQALEETILRPNEQLDALAQDVSTRWQLTRITVHPRAPLLYPSAGYFPLVAPPLGDGPCPVALAIPLSPIHALVGVPTDMKPEQLAYWTVNGAGVLSNWSVGHRSPVVVIPPCLVDTVPHTDLALGFRESRTALATSIGLCADAARLLRQMDDVIESASRLTAPPEAQS